MVKRDIRDYLNDILTHIDLAEQFTKEISFEEFQDDQKTILALTRAIEIVGEATKNIPENLREQYPSIDWGEVIGMRNRLAHAYFGIDLKIVWDAAQNDLTPLKSVVQNILDKIMDQKPTE